jgi:polyisoprenyl-teichoic acid--peptidoglycan teichoic acid transferase
VTAPARGRAKARRTWPQRLLIGGNIFLILICLLTAGGLGYAYSKVSSIGRVQLGNSLVPVDKTTGGGAENFLIVGTDSAEGLDPNDPVLAGRPGGLRSDTIMILRLDPSSDHAQLLSLPRDLYVPIDGQKGRDRINAAIQGGPERLINTIKSDFGIPINHYIEMNFFAFRSIVAAIGGVPVYFSTPVRDLQSGLGVDDTGCVTLDPVQALAFARSRDFEYFENGRWKSDPTGDLGRISRQQAFIRQVIQRAIDKGARNPAVLNDLIDTGTSALHLDPSLTPGDLVSLGRRFRDFNPQNLDTYSVPSTSATVQGADVQMLDLQRAEPILNLFRGTDPNAVDSTVVVVENGTPTPGFGGKAADDLRAAGFSIPPQYVGDADRFDYMRTVVRYVRGDEAKAEQVASRLIATPIVEETNYIVNADVVVIAGADWQGVRSSPGPSVSLPTNTTTTTTAPAIAPSTSTTVGVVPQTPEDVSC